MAGPTPTDTAALQARRLALALDAIEAQLDTLNLGAEPDVVAQALAWPIKVFDAAAKEALR
jgi:hypothetical protein